MHCYVRSSSSFFFCPIWVSNAFFLFLSLAGFLVTFYPNTLIMYMYVLWRLFGLRRVLFENGSGFLWIRFSFSEFLLLFKQTKHPFHYNIIKYYMAKSRKPTDARYHLDEKNSVPKQSICCCYWKQQKRCCRRHHHHPFVADDIVFYIFFLEKSHTHIATYRNDRYRDAFVYGIDAQPKYWMKKKRITNQQTTRKLSRSSSTKCERKL